MSMDRCSNCERAVDTDADAECYGELGDEPCMCEPCRDKIVAGQEEDKRLDDPRRR